LWHSRLHKDDLVLVCTESALNALSYHQAHRRADSRYLSTGGPVTKAQVELLTQAAAKLPSNGVVVLAFDNDEFGNELAATASQALGDKGVRVCRHAPPAPARFTSWNDVVREREHSFIQGLYQRQQARSPQPSPRGPELTR
jgi:ABC-type branched-subunit amino acid transport system substrate-binding protein